MTPEQLKTLKERLAAVTPSGWRTRLTRRGPYVIFTISEAPVDLLAVDAVAYPNHPTAKPYVKICPTAYEDFWDEASEAVLAIWRELCAASLLREFWIGSPGKPFAVTGK